MSGNRAEHRDSSTFIPREDPGCALDGQLPDEDAGIAWVRKVLFGPSQGAQLPKLPAPSSTNESRLAAEMDDGRSAGASMIPIPHYAPGYIATHWDGGSEALLRGDAQLAALSQPDQTLALASQDTDDSGQLYMGSATPWDASRSPPPCGAFPDPTTNAPGVWAETDRANAGSSRQVAANIHSQSTSLRAPATGVTSGVAKKHRVTKAGKPGAHPSRVVGESLRPLRHHALKGPSAPDVSSQTLTGPATDTSAWALLSGRGVVDADGAHNERFATDPAPQHGGSGESSATARSAAPAPQMTAAQTAVYVLEMTVLSGKGDRAQWGVHLPRFIADAYGATTETIFESWLYYTVDGQNRKVLPQCVSKIGHDLASLEALPSGPAEAIAETITACVRTFVPHEIPDVMNVVRGVSHTQAKERIKRRVEKVWSMSEWFAAEKAESHPED